MIRKLLKWLLVALAALLLGGVVYQRVATAAAFRRYKAPGQMFDVGGYKLHLHCVGIGPSVVLESGFGGWSIDWKSVQDDIGAFAHVCSYDRSGLGWSERGPASASTPAGIARQLKRLLDTAGVESPYVLVAHSLGGIYAREFARTYPKDVAGMVFVDSSHEEMSRTATEKQRTNVESQVRMLKFARYLMPFGVQRLARQPAANAANLAEPERSAATAIGYRSISYHAVYDEIAPLVAADAAGTLRLGAVPAVPIVALASGENIASNEHWKDLQQELAALSSTGELEIAEGSGHFIQVDQPERVIDAVRKVVTNEGAKA